MIQEFKLDLIDPNPWQTRGEDEEHVQKLAESIRKEGLLQVPVGRGTAGGRVELAFGHSRLAAFRLLNAEGVGFETFPVDVKEINDERMFELAVRENAERKDLTPIEEARAMRTYRETFKKTTKEIGELFALTDSAVRNKLRLLELPEELKPLVGRELTEGTARRLVTLQKVLPAEEMTELAASIKAGEVVSPEMVEELLEDTLRRTAFELRSKWDREPRVKDYLFRFDWKIPEDAMLPELKQKDLEALGLTGHELSEDELEKQQVLAAPPACNACPYHTVVNETHYCGMKPCFLRKKAVFIQMQLKRVSAETGIAIYDPDRDGNVFLAVSWFNDEKLKELLKKKEMLRVRPARSGSQYGRMENAEWVEILDISPDTVKAIEEHKKREVMSAQESKSEQARWEIQRANRRRMENAEWVEILDISPDTVKAIEEHKKPEVMSAQESKSEQARWEIPRANRRRSLEFVKAVAIEHFSHALDDIANVGLLEWLAGVSSQARTREEKLADLRMQLAEECLWHSLDWDIECQGPQVVAKHLAGVAKAIGLELPQDWEERAKGFEVMEVKG